MKLLNSFKKAAALLLSAALVFSFTACGSDTATEQNPDAQIMGRLSLSAIDEAEYNEMAQSSPAIQNAMPNISIVFFNSFNEMQMALTSGKIDFMRIGSTTGSWMSAQNPSFVTSNPEYKLVWEYSMLTMEENKELCDRISAAISEMREDGTLKDIVATHIDGMLNGGEPDSIEIPVIEGADTITVAVTGDLPPMDYLDVDGNPAGFNAAILAEISKRLNLNIETISIESGARAAALSSGKADVVFWSASVAGGSDVEFESDIDVPNGTIITTPYFSEEDITVTYSE